MNKEIVTAVQQRLADLGWYTGKMDGDAGKLTTDAIVAFKKATGLNPRAYVGVVTLHALFDDAAKKRPNTTSQTVSGQAVPSYPWMSAASALIGTKETPGKASNPAILRWAMELGVGKTYTNDGIAWCGLFVAYALRKGGITEPFPSNILGARQWLTFGVDVKPGWGSILVFWRGTKSGWQGHVGFYVGEDANYYYVLGGNQSDSVNIMKIAKNRLLGARAPKSVPFTSIVTKGSTSVAVSTNEA